jgi:hypothetical protein
MRVIVWPADQGACGSYRLMFPAWALAKQGADVIVDTVGPRVLWDQEWHGADPPSWVSVVGLDRKPDADVVVMQRPGRRWWADLIPHLQNAGCKVVVDIDDRFDMIEKGNVARPLYSMQHHGQGWIDRACELADVVTCTTPALRTRYGHGHGVVLPNLVPESYLSIQAEQRPETIGWSGTLDTHPGDMNPLGQSVARTLVTTDWKFHVIGTGRGMKRALKLTDEPTVSGWLPFKDYPKALAELAIGIVPLEDNPFNQAKSALKASEMASLGVPVIMSPTPDNQRLHNLGVGMLAASSGQWERRLKFLIRDESARAEMAEQGRAVMATQTYERHAERWWEAWTGEQRHRGHGTGTRPVERPRELAGTEQIRAQAGRVASPGPAGMKITVATTVAAYKCDGINELCWLEHAEAWMARGDVEIFCAVQTGQGHDHRFEKLNERLKALGATIWTFSCDDGSESITSGNRLQGICMGRNMAHEFLFRDSGRTHLLLLDSDVIPPPESIDRLLEVDHPIVGGHIPTYCLDGPKVKSDKIPAGADVREHWNTAGFLCLTREAAGRIRWGWNVDEGLTDDPWTQDLAVRVGLGECWVRHDLVGRHYSEAIGAVEFRGADLSIVRS